MRLHRWLAPIAVAASLALPCWTQSLQWAATSPGPDGGTLRPFGAVVDAAGDVIVVGAYEVQWTYSQIAVVKFSGSDGNVLWRSLIGRPTAAGEGHAVKIAPDGAIVVAASIAWGTATDLVTMRLAPSTGAVTAYMLYDSGGNDFPVAMALDAAGNPIVAARAITGFGTQAWRILKYDAAITQVLWQHSVGGEPFQNDTPTAIAVDAAGNVIVTGTDANGVQGNFRTLKYRGSDGAVLWDRTYDGGQSDHPTALALDAQGNVVVAGTTTVLNEAAFVIKYSGADGTVLWARGLTSGTNPSIALDMTLDPWGNAVVAGRMRRPGPCFDCGFNDDFWVFKLAGTDGALGWERVFNGRGNSTDYALTIATDAQGDVLATGWTINTSGDTLTLKLASGSGAILWEYHDDGIPPNGYDTPSKVLSVPNGAIAVSDSAPNSAGTGVLRVVKLSNAPARSGRARAFDLDGLGGIDLLMKDASGQLAAVLLKGTEAAMGLVAGGTGKTVLASADFNADGRADLLWRDAAGITWLRLADAWLSIADLPLLPAGSEWSVAHLADFDGDGRPDIVLKNAANAYAAWLGNGSFVTLPSPGAGWVLERVGDFNGDGRSDGLWIHPGGAVAITLGLGAAPSTMGRNNAGNRTNTAAAASGWSVAHVADFNGDGRSDILWAHTSGLHALWLMHGALPPTQHTIVAPGAGWTARLAADFNGDRKADLVWQGPSGETALWLMDGATVLEQRTLIAGSTGWSPVRAADFDGDGKTDLLWTNADGTVAAWLMNGPAPAAVVVLVGPGTGWRPALPELPGA